MGKKPAASRKNSARKKRGPGPVKAAKKKGSVSAKRLKTAKKKSGAAKRRRDAARAPPRKQEPTEEDNEEVKNVEKVMRIMTGKGRKNMELFVVKGFRFDSHDDWRGDGVEPHSEILGYYSSKEKANAAIVGVLKTHLARDVKVKGPKASAQLQGHEIANTSTWVKTKHRRYYPNYGYSGPLEDEATIDGCYDVIDTDMGEGEKLRLYVIGTRQNEPSCIDEEAACPY